MSTNTTNGRKNRISNEDNSAIDPILNGVATAVDTIAAAEADFRGDVPASVRAKAKMRIVCIVNGTERKVTVPGVPADLSHNGVRQHLATAGLCPFTVAAGGEYAPLDGSKPKAEGVGTDMCRGSHAAKYIASIVRPAM